MANEKTREGAYLSRQVPPWQLQSSFTNIIELHDDAKSRAAALNSPIGPSPLFEPAADPRLPTMASKKVTTTFAVRIASPFAHSPPAPLRRNLQRID